MFLFLLQHRLSLLESEVRRRCREVYPTGLPARNLIQLSRSFHSGEINKFHIFNTEHYSQGLFKRFVRFLKD